MKEDQQDDEYIFEDDTPYISEWLEFSIYSVILIAIGFLIPSIFSIDPDLDIYTESLKESAVTVGFCFLIFCLYKFANESGLFTKENPLPVPEFEENSHNKVIDLSRYRINKENTQVDSLEITSKLAEVRNFPRKLTQQILDEMEWRRFEQICSAYFTHAGVKNALTGLGADGGIDIKIFDEQTSDLISIVQCKRFNNPVSVKLIREFFGVMSSQNIPKGYFITTSSFHKNAIEFASSLNIELIDGRELLRMFEKLPEEAQTRLYELATHGDYKTPSCVKCGAKMIQRNNKKTGEPLWACRKYGCKSTLRIKSN